MVTFTAAENLTQVYVEPEGPRGETRTALTGNQKIVLWCMYAWEQNYSSEYSVPEYQGLSLARRRRAIQALHRKGLIDDFHWLTDRGRSYATRLRKV